MNQQRERTMFDTLATILRAFSVMTWITMAVTGYLWFNAAARDGVMFTVWGEALGITVVFLMSLVVWWYAGFVARKGREKVLRSESD
jgi:hypothetical protein